MPLHAAVSNNQTEVIRILRFYHADVYAENKVTVMCNTSCFHRSFKGVATKNSS